jgi:hypothetical protein
MSQSPPLDNRFLALRSAGQEATDFALSDDQVRSFMQLRDAGSGAGEIAAQLGLDGAVVAELVRADESQAVAHRIAIGELEMFPAPEPGQQVIDARRGSSAVPIVVLVVVLLGVIGYALLR